MSINEYKNTYGLLTKDGDGGDSCQRTCSFALSIVYSYEKKLAGYFIPFLELLYNPKYPFLWRRSPEENKWYSMWNRQSRDQMIPAIILLGEARRYKLLAWFIFGHLTRGMLFMTNTRKNFQYPTLAQHLERSTPDVKWDYRWKLPDLTGPEFWALEIRAMPLLIRIILWPVLAIFDLETLTGALVKRFVTPKDHDIINHGLVMINGMRNQPTPFMWLATKITNAKFVQDRLNSFFTQPGEPRLHEELKNAVEKYL